MSNKEKLGISIGRTVNLGDFQSYRIDVSVEIDNDPNEVSRDDAFEKIKHWAKLQINNEIKQINSKRKKANR